MRRSGLALLSGACMAAAVTGAPRRAEPAEKAVASEVEAARQSLVGRWQLNTALSDDPREKMREARERGGGGGGERGGERGGGGGGGWGGGGAGGSRGGGMGHGGGGGWGGGHGSGMGRGPQGGGESSVDATRAMLFAASQVTITNLTPEVTMLQPDGTFRRLAADGKARSDDAGIETKARWDDAKLVVETKRERGLLKETWTVSHDPRRLTVLMEIQHPFGDTVKVKRVFDAVDPNAPKPAPGEPSKP